MTEPYPDRLLPNAERYAGFSWSEDCFLCRRSIERAKMLTDYQVLEVSALQAEYFFDYSTNLVNCDGHKNSVDTNAKDVLIDVEDKHYTRTYFIGNEGKVPKAADIAFTVLSGIGYFMISIRALQRIKSQFPFSKEGPRKPNKTYNFELKISHRANIVNICHFEFECWSDINGKMARIKPASFGPGSYREIITHIIRSEIQGLTEAELIVSES